MNKNLGMLFVSATLALVPCSKAVAFEYSFVMTGAQEVSGGDPDGLGTGKVWINSLTNLITWNFTFSDILLPLSGFHIHNAVAGVNGPVVVDFSAMPSGSIVDADAQLIIASPLNYYVNAHNQDYPGGAVRGQFPAQGVAVPDVMSTGVGLLAAMGFLALMRRLLYLRKAAPRS